MPNVAVVDSGPLLALFDRDDAWHRAVLAALRSRPKLRLLTTWPVVTEVSALLGSRVGKQAELDFLEWIDLGGLRIEAQDSRALPAPRALVSKYRDLPFDLADASIAALAEELGIDTILTVDGDFNVYRNRRGKPLKNLLSKPTRPLSTRP